MTVFPSLRTFPILLTDDEIVTGCRIDCRLGLFHFYKAVGILGVTEMRVKLTEYAIRQRVEAEEMKVMASESKTGIYHFVSL